MFPVLTYRELYRMSHTLNLLRIAVRVLSAAWELANDPKIEADIETIQRDIQALMTDIQKDLDEQTKLGFEG